MNEIVQKFQDLYCNYYVVKYFKIRVELKTNSYEK